MLPAAAPQNEPPFGRHHGPDRSRSVAFGRPVRPARRIRLLILVLGLVLAFDAAVVGLRLGIVEPGVGAVTAAADPVIPLLDDPSPEPTSTSNLAPLFDVPRAAPTAPPPVEAPATPAPPPAPAESQPVAAPAPAPAANPAARIPLVPAEPKLAAFAGLSTWVDLHDVDLTPAEQVASAAAGGVETIFVQSARMNSPADIHDPARLSAAIELAHDAGMKVMVWYIPDFVDMERDLRRSQAAMAFVTPRGDRPDAFGLDIELEDVTDVAERTRRLLTLSDALRDWAGPDYPMAAIVLPPLQLDLRQSWWPGFPYAELRAYYDVFIPMSYSSYRGTSADQTYAWNLENVREMRRRAGDPALPVHLAGGIADNLPELGAFVAAARDAQVLGAGLYDLHTTRPDAWPTLRALRSRD